MFEPIRLYPFLAELRRGGSNRRTMYYPIRSIHNMPNLRQSRAYE
jgi:hypothetical protein